MLNVGNVEASKCSMNVSIIPEGIRSRPSSCATATTSSHRWCAFLRKSYSDRYSHSGFLYQDHK